MPFRKPQLIPLLFILCATLMLTGLGTWQVERLMWKNNLLHDIEAAQSLPALGTLPQDVTGLDYRKTVLTGKFLHDKTIHLIGPQRGPEVGYFIETPFVLEDDGRIVLVNRGFSPPDKASTPQGTMTIEGIIRPARKKAYFAPANFPEKNVWFYEDIPAISAYTQTELLPIIVEVSGTWEKDVYPIPGDGKISLRNDHLHYAIIWFSLAFLGLIMFGFYLREPKQKP